MSNLDQPFLRDQVFDMIDYGMRCRGESVLKGFFNLKCDKNDPVWLMVLFNEMLLANIFATFNLSSEQCKYLMRSE